MKLKKIINQIDEWDKKDSSLNGEEQEEFVPAEPLSAERQAEVDREADEAIKREIRHIVIGCAICSVIMCLLYAAFKHFSYKVAIGAVMGSAFAIAGFAYLGRSIQAAMEMGEEGQKYLKKTYTHRLVLTAAAVALAVFLPFVDTAAGVAPLFFPRLTIAGMQVLGMYKPQNFKK